MSKIGLYKDAISILEGVSRSVDERDITKVRCRELVGLLERLVRLNEFEIVSVTTDIYDFEVLHVEAGETAIVFKGEPPDIEHPTNEAGNIFDEVSNMVEYFGLSEAIPHDSINAFYTEAFSSGVKAARAQLGLLTGEDDER